MSILAMETNDHFTYDDGSKFVFAYYSPTDLCWYVQPRRFFLTKQKYRSILIGQFIQSTWFNILYKEDSQVLFVVLKVKKECSNNTIEKDMNSLKNPFPALYDVPPYVTRASYFSIPWNILRKLVKEASNKQDFKFTIRATNSPWDKLTLQIYKNDNNSIFITCPEFEIPLSY